MAAPVHATTAKRVRVVSYYNSNRACCVFELVSVVQQKRKTVQRRLKPRDSKAGSRGVSYLIAAGKGRLMK